ncbi:hypothetical protein K8638_02080 [Myxococcus sp. RHST-1-4]|nr:hypothetical protein [Myxococcus sp. RHSTA-1-4]
MATMAVVVFGILGISLVVLASSKQNRRNLIHAQAGLIAEQELERIVSMRCAAPPPAAPCANVAALDDTTRTVWWSSNGTPREVAPGAGDPERLRYEVAVDVDPPFEGQETGSPVLNRLVAGQPLSSVVNVRVTVSWLDADLGRRAVALQTRMAQ